MLCSFRPHHPGQKGIATEEIFPTSKSLSTQVAISCFSAKTGLRSLRSYQRLSYFKSCPKVVDRLEVSPSVAQADPKASKGIPKAPQNDPQREQKGTSPSHATLVQERPAPNYPTIIFFMFSQQRKNAFLQKSAIPRIPHENLHFQ